MQRLALFDMDNTLIDLDGAFGTWAAEFAATHDLGADGLRWILELDIPHRDLMFRWIKYHFDLEASAEDLWAAYRARMPHLVECRPEVLAMLARLRDGGWKVGIVTNGTADNQLGKLTTTGLAGGGRRIRPLRDRGDQEARRGPVRDRRHPMRGLSRGKGGWMVGDNPARRHRRRPRRRAPHDLGDPGAP